MRIKTVTISLLILISILLVMFFFGIEGKKSTGFEVINAGVSNE